MNTKLHINLHQGIVDVEGDTDLVREVYSDFKDHLLKRATSSPPARDEMPSNGGSRAPADRSNALDLSTNSIAARLNVTKGPELVIAAMAHLMIVQGKDRCTRKEINDEMKNATRYYKQNMTKNLSSALETHIKSQRVNEISKEVYALAASELSSLETQLAQ